VMGM
jgi:hypothetical protein